MTALLHADWPAPRGVQALTTLRHGAGVSPAPFDHFNFGNTGAGGDMPANVAANRAALVGIAGLPSPPHWLRQVHGVLVQRFDRPHPGPLPQAGEGVQATLSTAALVRDRGAPLLLPLPPAGEGRGEGAVRGLPGPPALSSPPTEVGACPTFFAAPTRARQGRDADIAVAAEPEADASATSVPGVVLAILTADCLPVVFAARDGSEIAAAHAGWRGLAAGVLERTLAAMTTPARDLVAWLGPAAGPLAYEVGVDVREAFTVGDADAARAFAPTRPGHWRVDLYALARRRLAVAGMAPDAIHGGNRCTISEPEAFFSHRRDANTGRLATLAWISR